MSPVGAFGPFFIVLILLWLGMITWWIITIVEIAKADFEKDDKTTWLLLVILLGLIGIIIYYAIGRSTRVEKNDINTLDDPF
jgi:hypothetical protein